MVDRFFARDEFFMRLALREAERALEHDDVPIGAVVVREGEVIGAGGNERELRQDPTAHAEIIALREAARATGSWRILDSVIYVTLEPCAMCAGAIVLARVPRVVYGTRDPKAGAAGSVFDILAEPRLNHRPEVAAGLLADECASLLTAFFSSRRQVVWGGAKFAAGTPAKWKLDSAVWGDRNGGLGPFHVEHPLFASDGRTQYTRWTGSRCGVTYHLTAFPGVRPGGPALKKRVKRRIFSFSVAPA